jgi:hypothetical protein
MKTNLKHCVPFQEVLFCQVIWPSDASPESMECPSILSKFQVHEVLIRRWISSQEREESDVSWRLFCGNTVTCVHQDCSASHFHFSRLQSVLCHTTSYVCTCTHTHTYTHTLILVVCYAVLGFIWFISLSCVQLGPGLAQPFIQPCINTNCAPLCSSTYTHTLATAVLYNFMRWLNPS